MHRLAAAALQPQLPGRQGRGGGDGQAEQQPAPPGPARHPALDQRDEDQQQHRGKQEVAGEVEPVLLRLVARRQQPERGGERRHPDEQVHQEDPAPAVRDPGQLHEDPAEQRPGRGRDADDPAQVAERAAAVLAGEQPLDDGADRRVVDARAEALHQPRDDQLARVLGDPAGHAGQREQAEPGEEEPLVAVPVAEPARRHERQSEGQRVPRDHPFQGAGARVRALLDARQRHVHDRGVKDGHEGAGQHDREDPPAALSRVSVGHRWPLPRAKHRKRRANLKIVIPNGRG